MSRRYVRTRQNDEHEIAEFLRSNGLDVRNVKLLTPLCDGDSEVRICFNSASKSDVSVAKELVEQKIGTLYDSVHMADTHSHLIATFE